MMKPSTKAKRLQLKIAYFVLSGRKVSREIVIQRDWWMSSSKIWHLKDPNAGPKTPHCESCRCFKNKQATAMCKSFSWDPGYWMYDTHKVCTPEELKGRRPCKRCLATLSKVANQDG